MYIIRSTHQVLRRFFLMIFANYSERVSYDGSDLRNYIHDEQD